MSFECLSPLSRITPREATFDAHNSNNTGLTLSAAAGTISSADGNPPLPSPWTDSHRIFSVPPSMNKKSFRAFSLFCFFSLFLPFSAVAQCKDQLCQNLQSILDAAVTDFREYRANRVALPDVSISGAKVLAK